MKRLLSVVSLSVFAPCLTVNFAYGMNKDDRPYEADLQCKGGAFKRAFTKEREEQQQITIYTPNEVYHSIIFYTLCLKSHALHSLLLVCKDWCAALKGCKVEDSSLTVDHRIPLVSFPYYYKWTNQILNNWSKADITFLYLFDNKVITDESIKNFTNLTDLDLCYNKVITDEGIKNFTNLTYLDLSYNEVLTDEGIKNFTNLTDLDLVGNELIKWRGLRHLKNLKGRENFRKSLGPAFIEDCRKNSFDAYNRGLSAQDSDGRMRAISESLEFLNFIAEIS